MEGAAVQEGEKESLVNCGLCIAAAIYIAAMAAVDEPQYTRDFFLPRILWHLMYCGTSALGVNAPQFESF